jgi:hypothetical protein
VRSESHRPRGSAYLLTLLALIALTSMGVVTVLVTRTELLIGSNETTLEELLAAAESGIAASVAKALTVQSYDAVHLVSTEGRGEGPPLVIRTSPLVLSRVTLCDLCAVAQETYGEHPFRRAAFAITATATKRADVGDLWSAKKSVSTIIEIQPWAAAPLAAGADPSTIREVQL